jgi:hypothetical protein
MFNIAGPGCGVELREGSLDPLSGEESVLEVDAGKAGFEGSCEGC